jgi:hypothetical protein
MSLSIGKSCVYTLGGCILFNSKKIGACVSQWFCPNRLCTYYQYSDDDSLTSHNILLILLSTFIKQEAWNKFNSEELF